MKLSSLFLIFPFLSACATQNIALIYNGPGACEEGCAKAAADMAVKAGLTPKYVAPDDTNPKIFKGAVLWIQPGGMSATVGKTINDKLRENLKSFIHQGGAYVGFCAGGFFAATPDEERRNLSLFEGEAIWHQGFPEPEEGVYVTPVKWNGKTRPVYWEGGPYFTLAPKSKFEATSYYYDGKIAGVRGSYGDGRVNVVGFHPEAPKWWFDDIKDVPKHPGVVKKEDTRLLDHDIALEMINWALKK